MAGPIRNSRVAAGVSPVGVATQAYVVPSGNVFLMKSVLIHSTNGLALQYQWFVSTPTIAVVFAEGLLAVNTVFNWSGWIALNAADRIILYATGDTYTYFIGGALLPFIGTVAAEEFPAPPFTPPPFNAPPTGPGIDTGIRLTP